MDGYILSTQDAAEVARSLGAKLVIPIHGKPEEAVERPRRATALGPRADQGPNPASLPAGPQLNCQRTPASLAIRFETALPVINPEGNPPPGEIHWPTM